MSPDRRHQPGDLEGAGNGVIMAAEQARHLGSVLEVGLGVGGHPTQLMGGGRPINLTRSKLLLLAVPPCYNTRMRLVLSKISDYGTTNPIVARLQLQPAELLKGTSKNSSFSGVVDLESG